MRYQPFRDNIFIIPEKRERQTRGGIVLPDSAKGTEYGKDFIIGRVVKAGAGGMGYNNSTGEFQFFEVDVSEGDRVIIGRQAGQEVIVGESIACASAPDYPAGTELRVVRNSEIAGVID